MIKSYPTLSNEEKQLVLQFIKKEGQEEITVAKLEEKYLTSTFEYGTGILFCFFEGHIVGKGELILKEASVTGACYLTACLAESLEVFQELLASAVELTKRCGGKKLYIGTKNERILAWLELIGTKGNYQSLIMTLPHDELKYEPLKVEQVCDENKDLFQQTYNAIFSEIPNGGTISDEEMEDVENHYFVCHQGNYVGVLITSLEEKVGFFDIGLCKAYRGMGLGNRLVDTAISLLKERGAERISLVVISKNNHAYQLYKRRGFVVESTINEWFEIE
ncbi:MAG: GNAT family N-acetyltransferase [Bacillaceae bacterium]